MSTHQATIQINPTAPAPLNFRQPRGVVFNCDMWFTQLDGSVYPDAASHHPLMVMRPRSQRGAWSYDINVVDNLAGHGFVQIPGPFFNDNSGYNVEVYARDSDGYPQDLYAKGRCYLDGGAFAYEGPLGPMTIPRGSEGPPGPTGDAGPAGQPGLPGQRGSLWFNGSGNPTLVAPTVQALDQYLDVSTGNVWQFDGATWARR